MALTSDPDQVGAVSGTTDDVSNDPEVVTPVVVDLGKVRRKHVKRLKRGSGKLAEEVLDVMDEVIDMLGDDLGGSTLVPIVMVYERKRKKSKRRTIELPF